MRVTRQASLPGRGHGLLPAGIWVLLTPALAIILLLFGGGLLLGLLQALGMGFGQQGQGPHLGHFHNILTAGEFRQSLGHTFYLAFSSTLLAAICSVILALSLIRLAPQNKPINFLLQIPLTVPHLVIAIAALFLLAPSGLFSRLAIHLGLLSGSGDFPLMVNDDFGLGILFVYTWKEIPFITFMILAVLKNLGPELLEVGATLKAGRWQRFRHIILPIIAPNLAAASFIVFAYTFGAFEVPYLLDKTYPMTLPVWAYKSYSDVDLVARPEGIALGLLIAAMVALAVLLAHFLFRIGRLRGNA